MDLRNLINQNDPERDSVLALIEQPREDAMSAMDEEFKNVSIFSTFTSDDSPFSSGF